MDLRMLREMALFEAVGAIGPEEGVFDPLIHENFAECLEDHNLQFNIVFSLEQLVVQLLKHNLLELAPKI